MTPNKIPIIYLAHPYGGDAKNLQKACKWRRVLRRKCPGAMFVAPWIELCDLYGGATEREFRAAGLAWDLRVVEACDGLLWVGGTSSGAAREAEHAIDHEIPVLDFSLILRPTGMDGSMYMRERWGTLNAWVHGIAEGGES